MIIDTALYYIESGFKQSKYVINGLFSLLNHWWRQNHLSDRMIRNRLYDNDVPKIKVKYFFSYFISTPFFRCTCWFLLLRKAVRYILLAYVSVNLQKNWTATCFPLSYFIHHITRKVDVDILDITNWQLYH